MSRMRTFQLETFVLKKLVNFACFCPMLKSRSLRSVNELSTNNEVIMRNSYQSISPYVSFPKPLNLSVGGSRSNFRTGRTKSAPTL